MFALTAHQSWPAVGLQGFRTRQVKVESFRNEKQQRARTAWRTDLDAVIQSEITTAAIFFTALTVTYTGSGVPLNVTMGAAP